MTTRYISDRKVFSEETMYILPFRKITGIVKGRQFQVSKRQVISASGEYSLFYSQKNSNFNRNTTFDWLNHFYFSQSDVSILSNFENVEDTDRECS